MGTGTRKLGTVAAALVVSVAVSAVALAAGGLKSAKQTTPVTEEITRAKAKCAGDRDAVSGGFRYQGDVNVLLVASSRPAGNDRWKAAIDNDENPDPGQTFSAYAYCREQNVSTESKRVTVPGDSAGGVAKATCPAGTRVLSGGFSTTPGQQLFPSDSKRAGKRGWKVNAAMFTDEDRTLKAFAVCGEGTVRKVRETTALGMPIDRSLVTVKCKQGERVVSGGFSSPEPLNKGGPFFDASYRSGPREWTVSVIGGFEIEVRAHAYCEET